DGDNLTVKTLEGSTNVVVVLTDATKVRTPVGLFRHSEQAVTALIPGLKVSVEGTGTQTRVVAKTIDLNKDDLLLAETIQAGLNPTQQQQATNISNIGENKDNIATNKEGIAANQQQGAKNQAATAANRGKIVANQQEIQATTQRFSELSEYDTKAKATVYFAIGSYTISDSDQAALSVLAQAASGLTGYIIQVKGIADPAAPNESSEGRADNRRVEVKVLVNRGVAGM